MLIKIDDKKKKSIHTNIHTPIYTSTQNKNNKLK